MPPRKRRSITPQSIEPVSPAQAFTRLPPENIFDWQNDTIRFSKLKELIAENKLLPPEKRLNKFDLLVKAGYDEDKARAYSNILVQNQKEKHVQSRGFDEESAKLVIQEIAHDDAVKADTRLKAAEAMLEVLGVYRKRDATGEVAVTLANILQDIYKRSESRPRLITVNEVKEIKPQ